MDVSITLSIIMLTGDSEMSFNLSNKLLELGDDNYAANFPKLIS